MSLQQRIQAFLTDLPAQRRRQLRDVQLADDQQLMLDGKPVVDFASNDYLGLSREPRLGAGARRWLEKWGTGCRASRLVTGNLDDLTSLESRVAELKGADTALIFGSGFQANSSILAALVDRRLAGGSSEIQVFVDRNCHASCHFGLAAAGKRQHRYRHNDVGHLNDLLLKKIRPGDLALIVTESLFSMDGDRADIAAIRDLAQQHSAMLFVDESHATGVLGAGGAGLANQLNDNEIVVGTFGKALGSYGAFAACSSPVREFLVNRCAGLIYSTALPPPVLGSIEAALQWLPELDDRRAHLSNLAGVMRSRLAGSGWDILQSDSHIIPVVIGSDDRLLEVAAGLLTAGFVVGAIRPPTVAEGTARLRISLSATHTLQQVTRFLEVLSGLAATGSAK